MGTRIRRALLLDRDGVINVDHGYVHRPKDFQFIEGIFDLVAAANKSGYLVLVVTNQAGIGRGYYSEEDFHAMTDWMHSQFAQRETRIDAVYFCPFHPEHGVGQYKKDVDCRKPKPGMLLQAASEHSVDLSRSFLVGDKISDIEAGLSAGVGTNILFGSNCPYEGDIKMISTLHEVIPLLSAE